MIIITFFWQETVTVAAVIDKSPKLATSDTDRQGFSNFTLNLIAS